MSNLLYQLDKNSLVALTQEDGRVTYPVQGGGTEDAPCMWFALCDNPAVTTEYTPVAGDVPICERCHTRMFPEKHQSK